VTFGFAHAVSSGLVCAAFLVIGVSARSLLGGRRRSAARLSLRLGAVAALAGVVLCLLTGPALSITWLTSFLALGGTRTFLAFHSMVILGVLMLLEAGAGVWLLLRGRLEKARWWLRAMAFSSPLPFLAVALGVLAAPSGRAFLAGIFVPAIGLTLGIGGLGILRRALAHGPVEPDDAVFAPLG
jgi:cytochrome bd-type quinol oxidase subunit 1